VQAITLAFILSAVSRPRNSLSVQRLIKTHLQGS
jgi:hypothetical protein